MYLTIVFSHLPLVPIISNPRGAEITRYTICVDMMSLLEPERDSLLFRDISVGVLDFDVGVNFLQPIEERLTHNAHKRRIFE